MAPPSWAASCGPIRRSSASCACLLPGFDHDPTCRISLLLRAELLDHFLFEVGPMSEALERRHLPVPDPPRRKRTNEFGQLVMRFCRNDEHAGGRAAQESSRADPALLPQLLEAPAHGVVQH